MSLAVAAIGAIVAALLELTIVPYLQIGGAQPDLVLVLAVAWTLVAGLEGGLVWAFVGGLMLDVLAARPLGSTPFVLLVCVGLAAAGARFLEPARWAGPAIASLVLGLVAALLFLVIYSAVRGPVPTGDLLGAILPRAFYDAVLGTVVGVITFWIRARRPPVRDWLDR